MKRHVFSLVATSLIVGFCSLASGDEGENFLGYYSWWEGTWDVETKVGDDVQKSEFVIERRKPACHVVAGDSTSLWGYDPELKQWVGHGFDGDGSRFRTVLDRPKADKITAGVVDRAKGVSWQTDGTKVIVEETWSYIDNNTAVIQQVRKTTDGKKLPNLVWTSKRK